MAAAMPMLRRRVLGPCLVRPAGTGRVREPWQRSLVVGSGCFLGNTTGPIKELHEEVGSRFSQLARGKPANISTAQLVQILFEVGAADLKTSTVGEVLSTLMVHGFYRQSHPQKRDSYGPAPVPNVGLEECQRWATMLFIQRIKRQELGSS